VCQRSTYGAAFMRAVTVFDASWAIPLHMLRAPPDPRLAAWRSMKVVEAGQKVIRVRILHSELSGRGQALAVSGRSDLAGRDSLVRIVSLCFAVLYGHIQVSAKIIGYPATGICTGNPIQCQGRDFVPQGPVRS
jgi:hypothetical protein